MRIQSGTATLNATDTEYVVVFPNPFYNDGLPVRVFTSVANSSADASKEEIFSIITAWSYTGFTAAVSGVPNTANYVLHWSAQGTKFSSEVVIPVEPYFDNDTPPTNSFGLGPY